MLNLPSPLHRLWFGGGGGHDEDEQWRFNRRRSTLALSPAGLCSGQWARRRGRSERTRGQVYGRGFTLGSHSRRRRRRINDQACRFTERAPLAAAVFGRLSAVDSLRAAAVRCRCCDEIRYISNATVIWHSGPTERGTGRCKLPGWLVSRMKDETKHVTKVPWSACRCCNLSFSVGLCPRPVIARRSQVRSVATGCGFARCCVRPPALKRRRLLSAAAAIGP